MIREMVLENFKSYAGAQRVGPFHKVGPTAAAAARGAPTAGGAWRPAAHFACTAGAAAGRGAVPPLPPASPNLWPCPPQSFSSVVGPNGSGKSNVIDAMLFVFGKRAKQLRLNKVSELIHNSTHHRNLPEARVSVHFQEIVDIVSVGGGAPPVCPLHLQVL